MTPPPSNGPQRTNDLAVKSPIDDLQPGARVGRFSILSELSAGGMGRIYEAYDPHLERHVALKLLHAVGDPKARDRVVQEARALARLEHPNVVTIHDVGTHDETLFVAMELVRGGTLKDWQEQHSLDAPGRLQTARRILLDAGHGLAAAHAAGLVHRDIKPNNILIGVGGRARIADFGVARAINSVPPDTESLPESMADSASLRVARAGPGTTTKRTSSGTPAYMAPEQFEHGPVGPAADQFAFCVTAWELLFGIPPFVGPDIGTRHAAIRSGALEKPSDTDVSPELEAILRRGLRFLPSERYPSLGELVAALEGVPTKQSAPNRRFVRGAVVAAVGTVILASVGAYQLAQPKEECREQAASAFATVWNDNHRENARSAVLGSAFGRSTWARIERGLDEYSAEWRDAHAASCRATIVRAEQSSHRMNAQHACLDEGRRYVEALLDLVSAGSPTTLANAAALIAALPETAACSSAHTVPRADESSTLDAVARARALRHTGRPGEAQKLLAPLATRPPTNMTPRIKARVLLEYGRALIEASNPQWALEALSEVYGVAQAEGFSTLGTDAAHALAEVYVHTLGDAELGQHWLRLARATEDGGSPRDRYRVLRLEASLLTLGGESQRALALLEQGVELAAEEPDLLPSARRHLARELKQRRMLPRAVEQGRQALRDQQELRGLDHPGLGPFERTLSGLLEESALTEATPSATASEAEALARHALERSQQLWGNNHPATSPDLVRLSSVQCRLQRNPAEGLQLAKDAVQLHPVDSVSLARRNALEAVARCALQGDAQFAKEAWDLVYLSKELFGEKHQRTILAQLRYAQALARAPHPDNERLWPQMLLTSALASEPARARDVYVAARVHGALGELAARVGKDSMGVEHAQAAVDMLKGRDAGDVLHARARKALCYATWKADLRDRALSECRAALEAASRSAEPRTLGLVHHTLGVMLWQLKRNEEALPHMERALSLFKQVGRDGSGLAKTHWVLGELNERVDRFREAKEHYHLSFEAFRVPYRAERASAGAGEARMLARLGKLDQARALLERLSEESNPSSPYEQAPLWETRGYIKHLQNPRDGAEEYERALDSCVASGKTVKIERLCSVSPFKHTECARLGYRNEPK